MAVMRCFADLTLRGPIVVRTGIAKASGNPYVIREGQFLDSDINKITLNLPEGMGDDLVPGDTYRVTCDTETEFRSNARVTIVAYAKLPAPASARS